jgi:Na+/melibiose symporter-like transporter
VAATEPQVTSPGFSTFRQIAISALWLAWNAQWWTIPPTILPDQVSGILGVDKGYAEAATGTIVAIGALVALLLAPVAGALSDRSRSSRGRRRGFLIVGVLGSCAGLGSLSLFGRGGSLALYALAYMNLQVWWNWAAGPYAGLIPDVVPPGNQAMASAWMNALGIVGVIAGNLLIRQFYRPDHPGSILGIFIAMNILCLLLTLAGANEAPGAVAPRRRAGAFLRSFYLSPRVYPNFYLVLLTRLFSNMGVWSIMTFLLFYLEFVLGMTRDDATHLLPTILGVGAVLAIPASLIGMKLADRYGLVIIVSWTSWIMAAAAGCFVLIAIHPSITAIVPVVIVFSVASGAYGAVDWYLALRVLPGGQDAGKDFGIWHVCMVLPQIIGPLSAGLLIMVGKGSVSARLAYELAFGIGALWFALSAALVGRIRVSDSPLARSLPRS